MLDARAADYASIDKQVPSGADALLGAGHILAEQFSENAEVLRLVDAAIAKGQFDWQIQFKSPMIDTLLPHLVLLSAEDRAELADEDGRIEAECAFCGARYLFSRGELESQ